VGRKRLIVGGMLIQGAALMVMVVVQGLGPWLVTGAALGVGTAMVYPTLLAAIGDVAHPSSRGTAFGIYRFWRDSGYVVGALLAGALADGFGMRVAIGAVGVLTLASGALAGARMPETLNLRRTDLPLGQ
jgi:MFS family permease